MPVEPTTDLDPRFSDPRAGPTPWAEGRALLEKARTYWISTVRSDGRPHVTTIAAVWLDDQLCFTTGETEQKARNLESNTAVVVTAGTHWFDGLDVVVEGEARRITDPARLERLAAAYIDKYGDLFRFVVRDGGLRLEEDGTGEVLAFEVVMTKAFGFAKGETFGQTTWRFESS
jgi:hypothetical protein